VYEQIKLFFLLLNKNNIFVNLYSVVQYMYEGITFNMTFQDYQLTRKAVLRNNMFKIAQYLVFLLI